MACTAFIELHLVQLCCHSVTRLLSQKAVMPASLRQVPWIASHQQVRYHQVPPCHRSVRRYHLHASGALTPHLQQQKQDRSELRISVRMLQLCQHLYALGRRDALCSLIDKSYIYLSPRRALQDLHLCSHAIPYCRPGPPRLS